MINRILNKMFRFDLKIYQMGGFIIERDDILRIFNISNTEYKIAKVQKFSMSEANALRDDFLKNVIEHIGRVEN